MLNIPYNVLQYRDKLWCAACDADGIPVTGSFVVFDSKNEAAIEYNNFMIAFFRAIQLVKDTGSSVLIYKATHRPGRTPIYGAEFTLPTWGERIGDRIEIDSITL